MKRSLLTALIIGVAVAAVVSALHASRLILGFETAAGTVVSDYTSATRVVSEKLQYVLILLLALGVAWLSLSSVPRSRIRLLVAFLLIELLGLSWICSLYRIFFRPLPSVFAAALALIVAEAWIAFLRRDRAHFARSLFGNRLSSKEFRRVARCGPNARAKRTSAFGENARRATIRSAVATRLPGTQPAMT